MTEMKKIEPLAPEKLKEILLSAKSDNEAIATFFDIYMDKINEIIDYLSATQKEES